MGTWQFKESFDDFLEGDFERVPVPINQGPNNFSSPDLEGIVGIYILKNSSLNYDSFELELDGPAPGIKRNIVTDEKLIVLQMDG